MSNTQGLLAFSAVHPARALLDRWPELEVLGEYPGLAAFESACPHCAQGRWGADVLPHTTKLLYLDGDWRVTADASLLMLAEEDRLAEASRALGPILVAMTQGTAGCASFHKYEGGALVRAIDYADGELKTQGEPLPEERGVELTSLYEDELERLWRAHGLLGLWLDQGRPEVAVVHCLDREEARAAQTARAPAPKRPWWRIW